MSFRDLDGSGPKIGCHSAQGGHGSSRQPKHRRDEDSPFEMGIKANIQEMQDARHKAISTLDNAERSSNAANLDDGIKRCLEHSRQLSHKTEKVFQEWTVHLAGEPAERYRKRFSMEKLQRAFEGEMFQLKEMARRAVQLRQRATNTFAANRTAAATAMAGDCGDDFELGLLDDSANAQSQNFAAMHESVWARLSSEREVGIRRIQTQVSEVNQIFRDLASIVSEQGQHIGSIESQAEAASAGTKQAVQELKKAVDRQRGLRQKVSCLLVAAGLFLCFVILPQMQVLQNHPGVNGLLTTTSPDTASASVERGNDLPDLRHQD